MSGTTSKALVSVGFFDLLFLVFLTLKLTHTIAWSWWFVTAPLWAPLCLIILAVIIFVVLAGCAAIFLRGK